MTELSPSDPLHILGETGLSILEAIPKADTIEKRIVAVGSIGLDGLVAQRNLTARDFDRATKCFTFFADKSSAKIASFALKPIVSLLYYDPSSDIQLRMQARVTCLCEDDLCKGYWDRFQDYQKRAYFPTVGDKRSDTVIRGTNGDGGAHLTPEELERGFSQFVVLKMKLRALRVLSLSRQGNIAGRYDYDEAGNLIDGAWIDPR